MGNHLTENAETATALDLKKTVSCIEILRSGCNEDVSLRAIYNLCDCTGFEEASGDPVL